jgi:hypothetical protein
MKEILIVLAMVGFYFLMQLYVLPRLGIST